MTECIEGCEYDGGNWFTCSYCGEKHCTKHRLPEKHNCIGLTIADTLGPEFRDYDGGDASETRSTSTHATSNQPDSDESSTTLSGGTCIRCGSEAVFGERYCEDCLSDVNATNEKEECSNCSAATTPDNDLCLDCRREQGALESRSPDLNLDGSLSKSASKQQATQPNSTQEKGFNHSLKSGVAWFHRAGKRTYRRIPVLKSIVTLSAIIVVASLVLGVGPVGQYANDIEETSAGAGDSVAQLFNSSDLNETEVEVTVHELINEERQAAGESKLAYDDDLASIARNHSEDMAERDFFAHTTPDGAGVDDRYDDYGYSCRIDLSGNSYIDGGGENIAQTYYNEDILVNGSTERYTTEEELAAGIVEQWMNSPDHRENLLRPFWENEGIGIHVTSEGEVFATQNFC